jgi:heat shock protein HslJ
MPTIMLVKVGGRGGGHLMQELAGEAWKVESIDGRPVLERSPVTLVFEDGTVRGSTGCNAYRGMIDLGRNGEAQTEILVVTGRTCISVLDEQQKRFRRAIRSARHVRSNRDGSLIARSTEVGDIVAKR